MSRYGEENMNRETEQGTITKISGSGNEELIMDCSSGNWKKGTD